MTEIPELSDHAKDLIQRVHAACPASIDYWRKRQPHLCFALPSGVSKGKKGRRVFFVIEVGKRGRASARPARQLKALAPTTRVTSDSVLDLVRVAKEACDAISKRAAPVGYQNTESRNVLAGGQFERNRRKF